MSTGRPATVVVTGAMGQVGQRVCGYLLERGRTVVALDLDSPATREVAADLERAQGPGRLAPVFADLTDADAVRRAFDEHQPDGIVHLAAIVSPVCYQRPDLARKVNVEGTRNLVRAAATLDHRPGFVYASSSAVYGPRNPYRHRDRITPQTPVDPCDCYGAHKVESEQIIADSGLPHAVLRLGGILSPEALNPGNASDYLLFVGAIPRDGRLHMVDARDVALAFANAVDRIDAVDGKVLLIGGDESFVNLQGTVQDELFAALGLGRLGGRGQLPGDPEDDRSWSFTDWFDTSESQALLDYQQHHWAETVDWIRSSQGIKRRLIQAAGPIGRPVLVGYLNHLHRRAGGGEYSRPWDRIAEAYGKEVLT
ncbi:MAG TPA: NAD-dependent epimerase/dehydratase family protein [Nocardioides sp.]|nr:NAD-dependent epimerase/dehydratase family protein [Nocardioides sp.]